MDKTQLYSYLKNVDALNAETLNETKKLTVDYPWFQAGWLLYLKNIKNQDCREYKETLKKVAVIVPDRKVLFKFLNAKLSLPKTGASPFNPGALTYKLEENKSQENPNSLIDKFLSSGRKNLHKVVPNTADGKLQENEEIIDRSLTTDNEMVTEMLASIYFQQKKYDEALNAYHKLSLKYPEKSVYFAARIKEIEEIKNNN